MKITFFLIAFCLVFVRLYLGWTGHWGNDNNDGTMTIRNGDEDLEIKWSGKVRLNNDETAVESITPGGFLKFKHNDEKFAAESNIQGEISYTMYDGSEQLILDEKGKKFLANAIHEMIELGYDAQGRMNRIYGKAGNKGLLAEVEKFKDDNLKGMYIDRLLKSDSLSKEEQLALVKQIGGLNADYQKENFLRRFTADQLKDSTLLQAWLRAVGPMGGETEKSNLLRYLIARDTVVSRQVFDQILDLAEHFNADWEKQNLLSQLIKRDTIPSNRIDQLLIVIGQFGDDHTKADLLSGLIDKDSLSTDHFNNLLGLVDHFGNDWEKQNLYKKLIARNRLTEEQWTGLIDQIAHIGSDFDKSNFLVEVARKMPKTENLRSAYLHAAKTINDDSQYGKTLRAVE